MSSTPPSTPHRTGPRSGRHSGRRALAAAAGLALTVALATGCTSAVDELQASAGEPAEGGVLRVGALNDVVPPSTFTNSSDTSNLLVGAVYDSLVDYPLDSVEPEPSLATSWEFSDDGTRLTLQLRDDVTFHTGRPFTSKDVEASIKAWADPTWTVQLQRTAAAVTGFDTSEEHAITLTFAHPLSNILDLLDMLPIVDAETLGDVRDGRSWVGTGPFVFESWKPGAELTLSANEDYWGGDPLLDGIDVAIIPDPQAQVAQLRAGQLDMVTGASARDVESLGDDDRFDVQEWEGAERQIYVGANVDNPALSDVRLRRAVAYALDRERIIDEVYRGSGTAAALPWPDYSPAYDAEAAQAYAYDPEQARALVAEVTAEGGAVPTLPLTYPAQGGNYAAVAQIVQADLAAVGIDVRLEPVEQADAVQQLIAGEFEGLWMLEHSYAQYNPSTLTVSAYPFNADGNTSHYVDADYRKHADTAWKKAPDDVTEADYEALNADLVDGAFLLEIGLLRPQTVTSSAVGDIAMTKRAEPLLGEAYLSGGAQ